MGLSYSPSGKDTEYAEIRGNLSENSCVLYWQAAKLYQVDDITVVLAGLLKSDAGLDYYPREKKPNYPELAFIKLRKGTFEVNTKNSKGDWEKVKREPIRIERCFVEEILSNWDSWKDKVWEGQINLNDLLLPPTETPIGKANTCWYFTENLHGKVLEWQQQEKKDFSGNKFVPKKSAVEIYEEAKTILEREATADSTLGLTLVKLKDRYGESVSAEIINAVVYGILAK
jgi:hypothetical protein